MKPLVLALVCLSLLLTTTCQRQPLKSASSSFTAPPPVSFCGPPRIVLNTPLGFDGTLVPLFAGLTENFTYPITTKSRAAQKYFDQGLVLAYGFNHAEAARSFQEAVRQDPSCAACQWGLGYVLGPNYNAPMDTNVLPAAHEAVRNAQLFAPSASTKEQVLIAALAKRYPPSVKDDPQPFYRAYADALAGAQRLFPDDTDIAAMHAEALMDLHPWDLWERTGEPKAWTPEILQTLEAALKKSPRHPQAMHLYIHATEASGNPERALPYANALRTLVKGSGHLVHMPSHTYINTGHYHDGALANEWGVKMDSSYLSACHVAGVYPLAYYPHNWHFLAACSAMEGNGKRAIEASRYMADHVVDKTVMRVPDLVTLQHFLSIPWFVMVKFARWDDLLAEPAPDKDLKYPTSIWHYARGMSFSAKGDLAAARAELAAVAVLEKDTSLSSMTIWGFNKMSDIVRIARLVLEGDIAWRGGDLAKGERLLQQAAGFEDQLLYQEPPDWFFSVRHLLGHVQLQAGRFAAAEATYREDLKEWKENGWALKGLERSLLKQGRPAEAKAVGARFEQAWRYASVRLDSSVL